MAGCLILCTFNQPHIHTHTHTERRDTGFVRLLCLHTHTHTWGCTPSAISLFCSFSRQTAARVRVAAKKKSQTQRFDKWCSKTRTRTLLMTVRIGEHNVHIHGVGQKRRKTFYAVRPRCLPTIWDRWLVKSSAAAKACKGCSVFLGLWSGLKVRVSNAAGLKLLIS